MGHAIFERVLLFGTRSADYIRASGHNGCIATEVTLQATTEAEYNAIENRDGRQLANMYADDAVLRVVDRDNPPSKPREIRGKAAITAYWDDVCGRTMTHKVEEAVAAGDRLPFT